MHKISHAERDAIQHSIENALEKIPEVSFAFLHGSFVKGEGFRDIDIAVFLEAVPSSPLEYEIQLESELMEVAGRHPVDVRILNLSPLSFRYNAIKYGILIAVKNDDKRVDFQEETFSRYFDFAPFRDMYLKETLGIGI